MVLMVVDPIALGSFEVGDVVVLSRPDEIWWVYSVNGGQEYNPTGVPSQELDICCKRPVLNVSGDDVLVMKWNLEAYIEWEL